MPVDELTEFAQLSRHDCCVNQQPEQSIVQLTKGQLIEQQAFGILNRKAKQNNTYNCDII
jgi:hypothetical protein